MKLISVIFALFALSSIVKGLVPALVVPGILGIGANIMMALNSGEGLDTGAFSGLNFSRSKYESDDD